MHSLCRRRRLPCALPGVAARSTRRRPWPRLALLVPLCALALHGCGGPQRQEGPRGLPAELALELALIPGTGPRLSIPSAYRVCAPDPSGAVSALRDGCTGSFASRPSGGRIADIQERAKREIQVRADPGAMHAAALIDLLSEPGVGKPLQRAISSLGTAARLSNRPAPVLADLAAAYLVRAERAHTPRDLLAAVDAAEEALEHEPRNRAALFNRALALERFGLVEEAARDWRAYLAVDPASPWADEARRRLGGLEAMETVPPEPAADAPASAYTAYAAADPQGARRLGWCRVLGEWSRAALGGDAAGAEAHLQRAQALGGALAARPGGDQTLADAVRTLRQATGSRRLAEAHREFAAGCALEKAVEFTAAAPRFAAAEAKADGSPVLRRWARLQYGGMLFRGADPAAGEPIFREVVATADTVRHPALAGYARQLLASRLARTQRFEPGVEQANRAAALFRRAGEGENEGAAWYVMSVAHFRMRDMDSGYAAAFRAIEVLRPSRGSHRLHNVLSSSAETVAEDGFGRTAVRLQDEGVRVSSRTGEAFYVAEARLTRARLLAATGQYARAGQDVDAARAVLGRIQEARARQWIAAQLQVAAAAITFRTEPSRAAPGLDSAATYFRELDAPLVVLPAVVDGARAWLEAGDVTRGEARLNTALELLEQRRDSIRMEPRRAAVFEAARTVVDRATLVRLASGRTTDALAAMDRGRASLAAAAGSGGAGAEDRVQGPAGAVAVEYALVGDTLLAWTVSGRDVQLSRSVVDAERLVQTVEGLLSLMERPAPEREIQPALDRLYDWLVRPLQARLGPPGTPLVVIADGELASVPFAALRDSRARRYLLQDHPLRFAASLREARRPAPAVSGAGALFVADPAFDAAAHRELGRLPGAAGEVAEIAPGYPSRRVLAAGEADEPAFRRALAGAGVVHYAGHAVFDDERPERSYLLLAAGPGAAGTLRAGDIAQMDLRHVSLVVLSACQTVRTGRGRAAGFSGLAGAFLAAGAGGAVGSLWDVDDRYSRRLMVEFHAAYRASGSGAAALRVAQLRMLESGDARLSSPSAWAAFRFAGS